MKRNFRLQRCKAALVVSSVACVLFWAANLRAQTPVVVNVTLANGDHVSGRFVAASAERLEIETTYAGRLSLRTAEIKSWQAGDETQRQVIASALTVRTKPAGAEVKKVEVKKAVATTGRVTKTDPWQRSVNLAYTLTRGNVNASDLNAAFGITRKRASSRTVYSALGRYGVRNGTQVAHLLTTLLRYERTLDKVPAFTETAFEIDRIKKLDYRFSESVGLSYPLLKRDAQTLSFDFGTGVTREVFSTGVERTTASSLLRAAATQKLNNKAQLSQQLTFSSDLFKPAEYRMQTDVSLTMPITKFVALKLTGFNRYDNRPQRNVKQNDFSLLTGFSFNF